MAVFLLKASTAPATDPPRCRELFDDVPVTLPRPPGSSSSPPKASPAAAAAATSAPATPSRAPRWRSSSWSQNTAPAIPRRPHRHGLRRRPRQQLRRRLDRATRPRGSHGWLWQNNYCPGTAVNRAAMAIFLFHSLPARPDLCEHRPPRHPQPGNGGHRQDDLGRRLRALRRGLERRPGGGDVPEVPGTVGGRGVGERGGGERVGVQRPSLVRRWNREIHHTGPAGAGWRRTPLRLRGVAAHDSDRQAGTCSGCSQFPAARLSGMWAS